MKDFYRICICLIVLTACGNSSESNDVKREEAAIDSVTSTVDDTIVEAQQEELNNESDEADVRASDTLPPPKKIIHSDNPSPKKEVVREMPRPGVSEQDKRYIDSVKAARKKLRNQ